MFYRFKCFLVLLTCTFSASISEAQVTTTDRIIAIHSIRALDDSTISKEISFRPAKSEGIYLDGNRTIRYHHSSTLPASSKSEEVTIDVEMFTEDTDSKTLSPMKVVQAKLQPIVNGEKFGEPTLLKVSREKKNKMTWKIVIPPRILKENQVYIVSFSGHSDEISTTRSIRFLVEEE